MAVVDILSNILQDVEFKEAIIIDEVREIIGQAKLSAPSPDGITYIHMKHTGDNMAVTVKAEYNQNLLAGEIPAKWLHRYATPKIKPGKNQSELSGYRIIIMQNTFGKNQENIVARRLSHDLEVQHKLLQCLGDTWKKYCD